MKRGQVYQQQLSFPGEQLREPIAAVELQHAQRLLARLLIAVVTAELPANEVSDEREDLAQPS